MSNLTEEMQVIQNEYEEMYRCMVEKDMAGLDALFADSFEIVHKNGAVQDKKTYLDAIADGTMNFYQYKHDNFTVTVTGDRAVAVGQTTFQFGQREAPGTSKLQLTIDLVRAGDSWKMVHAVGAEY